MKNLHRSINAYRSRELSDVFLFLLNLSHRAIPRRILRYLVSGRDKEILAIHLNPDGYCDRRDFQIDWSALNIVRKFVRLQTGYDLESVAKRSYLASEERCTATNVAISRGRLSTDTEKVLGYARNLIASVLGSFSWDDVVRSADFGPGASIGVGRKSSHGVYKIANQMATVTSLALPLLTTLKRWDSRLEQTGMRERIVDVAELTFVPKDARSHRAISIEPVWNMFFQKGIGRQIRTRLKRFGLDLDSGQERNREAARSSSVDGRYATVDLSSASDTVSYELVRYLLPEAWFNAMVRTRTPCVRIDGVTRYLRKFSSMGNGFTFELESLLFWAITRGCCSRDERASVAVFGDDIIVPTTSYNRLVLVLNEVGFVVNREKSFAAGPFRESCGGHFFRGADVTPLYIKDVARGPREIIARANNWKRLAFRLLGYGYGLHWAAKESWEDVLSQAPKATKNLHQPFTSEDRGFIVDYDEACPTKARYSYGFACRGLADPSPRSLKDFSEEHGVAMLILKLWASDRKGGVRCVTRSLPGRARALLGSGRAHGEVLGECTPAFPFRPGVHYRVVNYTVERWSGTGPWIYGLSP